MPSTRPRNGCKVGQVRKPTLRARSGLHSLHRTARQRPGSRDRVQKDRFTIGDLCEADLTKAIELAPQDPEPQRWLGRLKREQGDARSGDEIFAKAVELAKAKDYRHLLLTALRDWAENQLLLEQIDEAHKRADQILKEGGKPIYGVRPEFEKLSKFIHGEAWFRLGKWSDAIAAYDQALPAEKLETATLDDLPLLMHRAEAPVPTQTDRLREQCGNCSNFASRVGPRPGSRSR